MPGRLGDGAITVASGGLRAVEVECAEIYCVWDRACSDNLDINMGSLGEGFLGKKAMQECMSINRMHTDRSAHGFIVKQTHAVLMIAKGLRMDLFV